MTSLAATSPSPSFNKAVLPILQKNCQSCHRPGEPVPMSLLTYEQARPWGKAIKTSVVTRKMPPWFADPKYGHFQNDCTLSATDIDSLVSWVNNGALEGHSKDKPAPLTFHEAWNINPDMVIEMPNDFQMPARGTIDYQFFLVKGNFTEDVWVREAEMRAGNPKVVRHMKAWVRPVGSHWMRDALPGVAYSAKELGKNDMSEGNDILGKYSPGLGAQSFVVDGSAKFVPKGSDVIFEIHYTAKRRSHYRPRQARVGFCEGSSRHSLFYFLWTERLQSRDRARRRRCRVGERGHRGRRGEAGLRSATHASARERLRGPGDLSRRRIRNGIQG
jgi:hypothetical protein